ncbi:MAG: InlB B-repeat-containing protein, partial [Bacteroidales bacterium]|nr:InlB B-repeat-containing protein [Bacteroidales bacterium]
RYGETVTLNATANDGYEFQAYEDAEGKAVSYEPAFTTTVNGPLNLHARFAPRSYTLHAVPADKTLGQTKGSGLFAFGETVTVKAWPMAAGYTFSHWSADPQGNDRLSEEAEYQYTMTAENRTIYACFKLQTLQLELTANLPQAGTLQGGGEKTYGETVTVSATANEGYIWQGFSEYDVLMTEETSWTFTMTENRHIVGVFAPMMWQITAVDVPEGVKVKGTGEAAHGTQAEIEAVLPNTLDFVAWVDAEGNTVGTENPLRVTVQNDLQLTPRCTPHLLPLSVTIEPLGAGKVITDGFTDNAGAFRYGADIALEVLPAHGYTFVGWEEEGVSISAENPYTYRILNESQLKAVFQPAGWTITTGSNLTLGGTTAGDGIYPQGSTVEVTATPAAGFEFMHWSENGEIVSTDAVYRFVAENDRQLLADFQIHYFQIQVDADPSIGAKVSGSGAYSAQDTVTLKVTPTNGYAFIAWACEGETLSKETTYRFVPERDMQIVAQMKKLTTTVSVSASPFDAGTVTGGGEYRVGDLVTLKAIPNEGYDFRQWVDKKQNTVSLDQTFRFTADEDVAYIAEFSLKIEADPTVTVYPTPFNGEVHLEGENMDKI